tara:strand:- start:66 stop:344 length:279 start_codon:yes stop_codon:yes gene_type:complete
MHFYLVQVLTICDTLGVVKGDTVMTEQQQKQMMDNMNNLIAQVVNVVKFEIEEITEDRIRDIVTDTQVDEDQVRDIAQDEARDLINGASISA